MTEQQKTGDAFFEAQNDGAILSAGARMIDLKDLFYRLASGWKIIVGFALVCAVLAGGYTLYFVTPMYQATSILYVLSPESILNVSSLQLGTALTSDYIKVFDMWEVHEAVISNLNLNYTYAQMRDNLSVTNTPGTRMLDISFTSPSPTEAAAIANEYARVASEYIQETMATDKPNTMSQALEPANPVSPSLSRNVLIAFGLGGVLAAGVMSARFLTDDKIKTSEEIRECSGLVTLAVVPIDESATPAPDKGKKQKGKSE